MFVQGVNKENYSAMITVGAEGRDNDSSGLLVRDNQAELAPRGAPHLLRRRPDRRTPANR
jgi:hypothetical protein